MQLTDTETIEKNATRILERVSPSQVETFEMCNRRWYNDSVRGLREPMIPGSAADRGVKIAAEVEHFGQTGKLRDEALFRPMVEAVLPHLSPFSPTVHVEEWVESYTGLGRPKLRGRLDWFDEKQAQWEEGHLRAPLLADVKSRSDFRYAKTPAELADDLQLNAYAYPLVEAGGYEAIAMRHAYTRTSGKPKGMAVTVTVTKEELLPRWRRTVASIAEMTRWAHKRPATADELTPNTSACDKFRPHGCPHRALCGFDGSPSTLRSMIKMSDTNGAAPSDLMKRLQQRNAELLAARTGGAAPAEEQKPEAGARPAGDRGGADRAAGPSHSDLVAQALQKIMSGAIKLDGSGQVFTKDGADSGWLLRQPTPAESEAFAASAERKEEVERETSEGPAVVSPDAPSRTNDAPSLAEAAGEAQPAADKPKRARKVKADPAQTTLPGDQAVVVPLGRPAAEVATEVSNAVRSVDVGPVVYVNCLPTKGPHKALGIYFEEWMAPICEEVAREKNVADWRLIQYTAKGDLAAKVRQVIGSCPAVVLVSKFSPAADVFLESVIPWASQIIQGV